MVMQKHQKTRVENRLPVAREGIPFMVAGALLTGLFAFFGLLLPAVLLGFLTGFIIYFFRDPERTPPAVDGAVLSPADGRVLSASPRGDDQNPLGRPCMQVSIFMSLFNVHVNRMVSTGVVKAVRYHAGRFFAANLDKASEQNERNELTLETPDGRTLVVVQVAGLVARRIACWVEKGDHVDGGQRFGLIRFGSRLDVFLPEDTRIIVEAGHKVHAGESVLGYLSGSARSPRAGL